MKKSFNDRVLITGFLAFITYSLISTALAQSMVVYEKDDLYKVKINLTDEVIFSNSDASTAIQWAINNIGLHDNSGGDVLIQKGSYLLSNGITLKSNVWLHGEGTDTKLITNAGIRESIVIQDASLAVISDLALINGNNYFHGAIGIQIERSINCQVLNVHVANFNAGIANDYESALTLINKNKLEKNKVNIRIKSGGGVIARWLPILITENYIDGGETGIFCNAICTNIIKNEIKNLKGRGIVANRNSIVVRENVISNVAGDFAIYGDGQEFNCTDNKISNVSGGGIRSTTRWGTITNNYIKNFGQSDSTSYGILVESEKNRWEGIAESKVVFNNTIYNEEELEPLDYGIKENGVSNIIMNNATTNVSNTIISEGEGTVVMDNQDN